MKSKVIAWLLTWFIFAQSTLISYHTEGFVKTEVGFTVASHSNSFLQFSKIDTCHFIEKMLSISNCILLLFPPIGFMTTKGELVRSILFPPPLDFQFHRDFLKSIYVFLTLGLIGMAYSLTMWILNGVRSVSISFYCWIASQWARNRFNLTYRG